MSSLLFSPDDRMRTLMFLMLLDLHSCLPNLYLHKKTDLTGFVKIKPRHQDGLKKTDLGGKTQQWEPQCCQLFSQKIYQIISKNIPNIYQIHICDETYFNAAFSSLFYFF